MMYDYRCAAHGMFEKDFSMGCAEAVVECPECGSEAKRVFTVGCLRPNGAGRPVSASVFNKEMTERNARAGRRMRKEHGEAPVRLVAHDYGNGDVREVKK